jgi:hypothetical protein
MKSKAAAALIALSVGAGVAHADPYAINQISAGSTNYAFFILKPSKLKTTVAQATLNLANALAPYGVSPCIVTADANGTIVCGTPSTPTFMLPVPNEFFTYDLADNFKDLPPINDRKGFNKDGLYNQVYAVNFLQPVGMTPGDAAGRNPVHVQFAVPVTEFSFLADGGQAIAPASTQIQFTVNGIALPPQDMTPGTPVRLGVADPAGFTEVTINALGGYTQAFIASEFAFLPMQ